MQSIIQWIKRAKLKDWLRLIDRLLPHAAIVASGMLITFFLIDRVNKPMAFMTNEFHKRLTFVLALMCIYLAIRRAAALRAQDRGAAPRRPRQTPPPARRQPDPPRYSSGYASRRAADYAPRSRRESDFEPRYGTRSWREP